MLHEFIITSFATFIGWQVFKSLLWFEIPRRLTTFLVLAVSYGMTCLTHPSVIVAFASTGGCALIFKFIDEEHPWNVPKILEIRRNKRTRQAIKNTASSRTVSRVPPL